MVKKSLLISIIVLAFFTPTIMAHETENTNHHVDTVILASMENYPDALVAGSAAAKAGVPILLTEKDELSQQTTDVLQRLSPTEIIVAGGEAVISADVKAELEAQGYDVVRLWGTTRYGTSVEIAEHFWAEGTDEAILVQDSLNEQNGNLLSAAKELARNEDNPMYLTPEDSVPAVVQSSLENLGVQQVTIIGTEISEEYRNAITDLGITIKEEVTGSDEEVQGKVQTKISAHLNASQTLVVVASDDFRHALATSNFPDHHVFLVSEEDGIEDAVETVNEQGVNTVKIVGQSGLSETTATTLRAQTQAEVEVVAETDAVQANADLTGEQEERFAQHHIEQMERWEQRRSEREAHMKQWVNKTINKADNMVDENSSEKARQLLAEARVLYSNEEYFEAREVAHEAISEVRHERWKERQDDHHEAVREAMEEEMESLRERVEELRELNGEFAAEMEANLTVEERLEVIEEFRHERRETVQELVEEARKTDAGIQEGLNDRLQDARKRIRDRSTHERFRFEAECTDESTEGITVTRSSVSGDDGKVVVSGRLLLPTPNYNADASVEARTDDTVDLTVDLKQTDGFGVQCVAEAEYKYEVDAAAGDWTVNFVLNADGEQVRSETQTVTVTPDDEEEHDETETEAEAQAEIEAEFGENGTETHVVEYTSDGFSPQQLEIEEGDTVVWESSNANMWVASDVHTSHTAYHGTTRSEHCGSEDLEDVRFDACEGSSRYDFTFEQAGEWEYHDHNAAHNTGTIVVR